ncbi:hypothetical protein NUW58_g6863 [Xylaria curta]|uniref:Uncharacterized protein n=1 Tax=Xylaria curta TaxID=42375 RepID=A0ACC1NPC3_9PEZI|nr:hypothetical protein NUW58_g6863 [Xylaria curta]
MFRLIDAGQVCNAYKIELRIFLYEEPTPPYVIFSHAPGWMNESTRQWSNGSHDLAFRRMHEFKNPWDESLHSSKQRAYQKVFRACECALRLGYQFIWINTVCVDESDSGEMNRSAGAMFKWYSNAEACLVHLPDSYGANHGEKCLYTRQEKPCTWWTQCWTFTALLASKQLYIYNGEGVLIIHYVKQPQYPCGSIQRHIMEITEIHPDALFGTTPLSNFSFKAKMTWCQRQTDYKRQEDLVYCLIGAFDVNMDGSYGEGSSVAYRRFQSKVIRSTHDLSILAWDDEANYPEGEACRALARSRHQFATHVADEGIMFRQPLRITDRGIEIRHQLHTIPTYGIDRYFLILGPGWREDQVAGIFLEPVGKMLFRRIGGGISIFDRTVPVPLGDTRDITIQTW